MKRRVFKIIPRAEERFAISGRVNKKLTRFISAFKNPILIRKIKINILRSELKQ